MTFKQPRKRRRTVSRSTPALGAAFVGALAPVTAHPALDWNDPTAVSRWLAGLRVSWEDADAIVLDMLRPPRERELGPVIHARDYAAARAQILSALAFGGAPEPDPLPRQPARPAERRAGQGRRVMKKSRRGPSSIGS